jgi:Domain of unknown function (DUF6570)
MAPRQLPNLKQLYSTFYNRIEAVTNNFVCACCASLGHEKDDYLKKPLTPSLIQHTLTIIAVNVADVPFPFPCRHELLDSHNIMVDKLGIIPNNQGDGHDIILCTPCHTSLLIGKCLPKNALANRRWIGEVPDELKDLHWLEECVSLCDSQSAFRG